jgi:signal peptidase II
MPFSLRGPRAVGCAAALLALALDQGHKFFMLQVFDIALHQPIRVTPFLDLILSWNHGISYSLFSAPGETTRILLLLFQSAIVCGLAVWMWRAPRRLTAAALGLVIGGALGNIVDRLLRGAVADFFFFHVALPVGPLANYVFNVADAAIFVGVALLLIESLRAGADARTTTAG